MENEEIYSIAQRDEHKEIVYFSICGITYPNKNYEIIRGASSTACIEYIEEGIGKVKIGDKEFYAAEGDSYYLHQNFAQHYYSDSEQPWKKYFINLSGSLVDSLTDGYGLKNCFYFKGLNLKEELCRIIEIAKRGENDNTKELVGIVNEIFLKMRSHIINDSRQDSPAAQMKDFLNTKLLDDFRIEELCRYINKSESRTIQIFKKAYGVTPYAYLLNERVSLAKNMLRNTNLTIKQIAYKLKFADEYYFSNVFKNKTGVSPLRYRKMQLFCE